MRIPILMLSVLSLACGGPALRYGAGEVEGSIDGQPFTLKEALLLDSSTSQRLTLVLASSTDSCATLAEHNAQWGQTITLNLLGNQPGTYTLITQTELRANTASPATKPHAWAHYSGQSLGGAHAQDATAGRVQVEAVSLAASTPARGSFELHFGDDLVAGWFQASACDRPTR